MRRLLLFIYLYLLGNASYSQQDFTLKNIIPPSPEASAFIKYGNYQIGAYTGRPDINIPLYEIQTNKLSLPVTLNYDETGIRVNEMASWVGMNWSLDAGGMISRVVIGEPDIINSTTYEALPPRADQIVDDQNYFNYLRSLVENDVMYPTNHPDAEPDRYYYSFKGHSGSFVFDRDRNIMQIPKTSLKITVTGNMDGFNIIDETGATYVFSSTESTESFIYSGAGQFPDAKNNPFSSTSRIQKTAFYLSEIISNDGLEHIYFTYENETTAAKDDNYSETFGPKYNQGTQFPTSNYHEYRWNATQRVITIPRLKAINFPNGKLEFIRVSGRQDDAGGSSRLDEINVYQKINNVYTKLKSFKFIQGYYYSSVTYAQNSGLPNVTDDRYRLRLDAIKLKDAAGSEISDYEFSYNTGILPPKTSCSQDWWGYYNGAPNSTLVPATTVFNGVQFSIGSADRNSNETYMKAGILEKITYPTGGYTVFETESHKLKKDYSVVNEIHSAYAAPSSNLTVQTFTAPSLIQAGSGQINITIGPYTSGDPQPFVKIKNVTTGQEQTIVSPNMNNFYSYNMSYEFIAGNAYELTASCYANQSYSMAYIGLAFGKQIYDPHLEAVGGLRIKSIKNYNSDNVLTNEENYRYGPNENGTGVFVGVGINTFSYGRDQVVYFEAGNQCVVWLGGVYGIFQGGPLFDPALVQGSAVVYTDVVKYYGNPSSNAGKTYYYYGTENQQLVETRPLPASQVLANNKGIIIINESWKKGQLLRQEEYRRNSDGSFSKVQDTENTYDIINKETTYGLFAQLKYDRVVIGPRCLIKMFGDFAYAEYPINTGYVQLTKTAKRTYEPGAADYIQVVTNNTYDNIHQDIITKTSIANSEHQIIEKETKYPFNKAQLLTSITANESTALDAMVTKNMLFPIEEIERNNGTQIALKKTSYEYVNTNTIAPVNLRYQLKANPIETRVKYTKYDDYGHLVEQSKANDITQSYIWGYNNQYPVAEVVGAPYSAVMAVLNQSILDNPSDDAALRTELNKIRINFPSSFVKTYTYKPVVGITSVTDLNNRTNYYEYDSFQRLKLIRDKDGYVIKTFEYKYKQ
jgi:hypothetical protein